MMLRLQGISMILRIYHKVRLHKDTTPTCFNKYYSVRDHKKHLSKTTIMCKDTREPNLNKYSNTALQRFGQILRQTRISKDAIEKKTKKKCNKYPSKS